MLETVFIFLFCVLQVEGRGTLLNTVCTSSSYCYSLWQLNPPLSKWEANKHCQSHNQMLATIPNTADQETLTRQLRSNPAWVGLNVEPTTNWKWLGDGGWHENTISVQDESNGACMIMNRENVFSGPCSPNMEYLCEFKTKPPASTGCNLESAFIGNKYVCMKKVSTNWMNAARFCTSQGGNLLNINNAAELGQIKKKLREWGTGSLFYIGGTRVILSWEEHGVRSNPYALKWSTNTSVNPNLDGAAGNGESFCMFLSDLMKGLVSTRCSRNFPRAFCLLRNHTDGGGGITAPKPLTVVGDDATKRMVSQEKYTVAMICAFVVPTLLVVIAIIAGVLICRKKRNKRQITGSYRARSSSSCGDAEFSEAGSVVSGENQPQLPPRLACDPNAADQPLPPPPPDLLDHHAPLSLKHRPIPENDVVPFGKAPPPLSETNQRPPRRQKMKRIAPDPTYAQIDKTAKLPPPVSPKPSLQHLSSIATTGPHDNSESGAETIISYM